MVWAEIMPWPILEGCLEAISRFPINIKFVGKIEK